MPFAESSLCKEINEEESILVSDFSLLEKYGEDIASMRQAYKILLLEKEENTDKLCFCFLLFSVLITAFRLKYH